MGCAASIDARNYSDDCIDSDNDSDDEPLTDEKIEEVLDSLSQTKDEMVTQDPELPLKQFIETMEEFNLPKDRLADFLIEIRVAETTAEIYHKTKEDVDIGDLSDSFMESDDKDAPSAVRCMSMLIDLWMRLTNLNHDFAAHFIETGLIPDVVKHLHELEGKMETHFGVWFKLLAILNNCCRIREEKDYFRNLGTFQLLKPYVSSDDEAILGYLKQLALLTLSYIADEDDFELLRGDDDVFDSLLEDVTDAWGNENHKDPQGFTVEELLEGLGNLSQNDDNKKLLMGKDVVRILKPIIKEGRSDESRLAANIVWMLAFDEDNRALMKEDTDLLRCLEKQSDSQTCNGALWTIRMETSSPSPEDSILSEGSEAVEEAEIEPSSEAPEREKGHVMISYQWGNQETLLKIRDSLRDNGFRVWMDVDDMSGSTLQAMADAVENAAVILVSMSRRYKDSPNCRSEAQYAHVLKKPIIPLMMERDYKPDGWLGIMTASMLYFDFSGKYSFEDSLEKLITELRRKEN